MNLADKINGMFLGLFLGDALGMPVETWTPSQIKERYGRIETCIEPKGHKWWDGHPAGGYTDDTQLSLAVAKALIDAKCFYMRAIVTRHIEAFDADTGGWGHSTKKAVEKLKQGESWLTSGVGVWDEYGIGGGNGVPMKVAPLAALYAARMYNVGLKISSEETIKYLADGVTAVRQLSDMTHSTRLSFAAGLSQFMAVMYCLLTEAGEFEAETFKGHVLNGATLTGCSELESVYKKAFANRNEPSLAVVQIGGHNKKRFDCLRSLPLTYYSFLQDPMSFESVLFAVGAGGDTDTNASMVGALIGALHGPSVFPQKTLDSLLPEARDEVSGVADQFCQTFVNDD